MQVLLPVQDGIHEFIEDQMSFDCTLCRCTCTLVHSAEITLTGLARSLRKKATDFQAARGPSNVMVGLDVFLIKLMMPQLVVITEELTSLLSRKRGK